VNEDWNGTYLIRCYISLRIESKRKSIIGSQSKDRRWLNDGETIKIDRRRFISKVSNCQDSVRLERNRCWKG